MPTPTTTTSSSSSNKQNKKVCITGGTGYVGFTLALRLVDRGFHSITILDWTKNPPAAEKLPPEITFQRVDIRDQAALTTAFQGSSIIFHVASYGMSGSSQLNKALVESINIEGTKAVLNAAIASGVERLVFTSTYNVVFGGQSITLGDESLPYFPFNKHPDAYSRTKAIAESLVLSYSGAPLHHPKTGRRTRSSSRNFLHTCAVRPAAIWGPDEQRHTPRIVSYLEKGLFCFTFGSPKSLMEFVHVENLVQAHILAAEALTEENGRIAAGQAYFISDGEGAAINNFEFFRPLVEGLGYQFPVVRLPLQFIYFIAFITEQIHKIIASFYPFEPLLTRAEVFKAGQNHYFSIEKARLELGYRPKKFDIDEVVQVYRAQGRYNKHKRSRIFIVIVLLLIVVVAYFVKKLI